MKHYTEKFRKCLEDAYNECGQKQDSAKNKQTEVIDSIYKFAASLPESENPLARVDGRYFAFVADPLGWFDWYSDTVRGK